MKLWVVTVMDEGCLENVYVFSSAEKAEAFNRPGNDVYERGRVTEVDLDAAEKIPVPVLAEKIPVPVLVGWKTGL